MKLITAILQPETMDAVIEALTTLGIHGLTISEAHGYGRQRGHTEVFRSATFTVDILPKVRFEVVSEDARVNEVVDAICSAAYSGQIGDGKVWVTPVESITRVRTRETGADAL
ncbi:transcriptional regulator [Alloscardovia macacae]|uniref:Transcriptional regulator n=1 Tax=Alloscardovia macacae TaxID=1160091 RepID=A0A1Y2ST19_9BIFI|nr:P-II family nitrogen regulator [Alloscardovia macacae]OTA25986.1 transcriptional regulator [Alloscardovia macacae]OTA28753.1 transcriptional regulator [Alloscardovia macacae]